MTSAANPLGHDERSESREPVLFRTRVLGADGAECPAILVNVSPGGFMARCDTPYAAGESVGVVVPRLGKVAAEVRWALGGRIGCRWQRPIGPADYHAMLHALPRG